MYFCLSANGRPLHPLCDDGRRRGDVKPKRLDRHSPKGKMILVRIVRFITQKKREAFAETDKIAKYAPLITQLHEAPISSHTDIVARLYARRGLFAGDPPL